MQAASLHRSGIIPIILAKSFLFEDQNAVALHLALGRKKYKSHITIYIALFTKCQFLFVHAE